MTYNISSFALDPRALERLRTDAGAVPESSRDASKQFEAMFVNMLMKSMRDAAPRTARSTAIRRACIRACSISNSRNRWHRRVSVSPISWRASSARRRHLLPMLSHRLRHRSQPTRPSRPNQIPSPPLCAVMRVHDGSSTRCGRTLWKLRAQRVSHHSSFSDKLRSSLGGARGRSGPQTAARLTISSASKQAAPGTDTRVTQELRIRSGHKAASCREVSFVCVLCRSISRLRECAQEQSALCPGFAGRCGSGCFRARSSEGRLRDGSGVRFQAYARHHEQRLAAGTIRRLTCSRGRVCSR